MSAELEPGPELDGVNEWLAEHLMGGELDKQGTLWVRTPREDGTVQVEFERDWTPSTSPGLAMDEVVPAMAKHGCGWHFSCGKRFNEDEYWATFEPSCGFTDDAPISLLISTTATAKTLAGAICLAAKAALEAKELDHATA